jgi:ATP-binding protein involved in chromosome partitioning
MRSLAQPIGTLRSAVPDPASAHTPVEIRQQGPTRLAIHWADGRESVFEVRALRLACGCARCVDEWSGDGILDPESVPDDVHPLRITPVGRYAIQIHWSDGHDTGIYPFRRLRALDAPV